jgi:hypothetical protein
MNTEPPHNIVQRVAPNVPKSLGIKLAHLLSKQPRFVEFVKRHDNKISKKFKSATTAEDARDVLAELETACGFIANPNFSVEYEPYVNGGCDFRITTPSGIFNAEIKRIRETDAMNRFYCCWNRIIKALRAVPSQCGISLICLSSDVGPQYVQDLDESIDNIITECTARLKECKDHLRNGKSKTFSITSFPKLQIEITHEPKKTPDSPTANFGGAYPIPYTQRESFKFTDHLLGSLRQFKDDLASILIIRSHSTTHDAEELSMAACAIQRHVYEGNESFFQEKGFCGIQGFQGKFKRLSAAVVITGAITTASPRNVLWTNPTAARPFDDTLLQYFGEM